MGVSHKVLEHFKKWMKLLWTLIPSIKLSNAIFYNYVEVFQGSCLWFHAL